VFVANARVSVLRGTFTDGYDDVHDTVRPVAVDVPASLILATQTVVSPETGRSFDVQVMQGIVRRAVDVQKGDRIKDQATGLVYTVDAVTQSGAFIPADKRLKMRLLSA
jgi:hypothetical protein